VKGCARFWAQQRKEEKMKSKSLRFPVYFVILLASASSYFSSGLIADAPLQDEALLETLVQQSVSQGYNEEFIDLVEMIYGKGFLSQGGGESIELMIDGVPITKKRILDIGSGLGGPAIYLAEHYPLEITGLEPQKCLFERALKNLDEKKEELKGSLRFVLMEHPARLAQFAEASFDIVMSKEAILHIPIEVKKAFFKEIYRVLKPEGEIVIMDWLRSKADYSKNTQKMMEMDGVAYHLITPSDYRDMLQEAGFSQVQFENVSQETAKLSKANLSTIQNLEAIIKKRYGQEVYDYCIESWGYQRDAFTNEELITGVFRAKKHAPEE
jgi:phosphoethanolamine N-methyltransferase